MQLNKAQHNIEKGDVGFSLESHEDKLPEMDHLRWVGTCRSNTFCVKKIGATYGITISTSKRFKIMPKPHKFSINFTEGKGYLKHDQSRSNDLIPLFAFGVMEALIGDETATTSKKMSRCRIGLSICCGDRPSSSLLTIRGLKCHGIRKWMVCINFG